MNYEALANLFWNALVGAAILWGVYGLYVSTLKAEFRHDLFALRRELFMHMAEGRINRDDPTYELLRSLLNGLLYRAEDITGIQVLVISIGCRRVAAKSTTALNREFERIEDPHAKAVLQDIHSRTTQAMVRHVLHLLPISPALWMGTFMVIGANVFRFLKSNRRDPTHMRKEVFVDARSPESLVVRGLTADALHVADGAALLAC